MTTVIFNIIITIIPIVIIITIVIVVIIVFTIVTISNMYGVLLQGFRFLPRWLAH